MNIPASIVNSIPKSPTDNTYFYNAEELWTRLKEIRENRISFIRQDMGTLANAMELYYKGFIEASGVTVPEQVMKESHSLYRLTQEIESKIMPLSAPLGRNEARARRNFLFDLSDAYIECRYQMTQYTKMEFDQVFDWAQKQRTLILETLQPIRRNDYNDYEPDL